MLKSLDVLVGLTVVLLALSMAVTVITQSITTLLNSRGRHLRRGLTDLLQQLDPALTEQVSKIVATKLLTHPLVSGSSSPISSAQSERRFAKWMNRLRALLGGQRLGNVVHREEFTKLLMGLACGDNTDETVKALQTALKGNGIQDPTATLKSIRTVAMQLEKSSPELSHTMRQNIALLHEAESDLVAKINNWFDQTMDRTSQRFTASTRAVTFAASFIVAFGLQVDTPNLVNRLAADDKLRDALVAEAQALKNDEDRRETKEEAARAEAGAAAGTQAAAITPPIPPPAAGDSNDPTSAEMISRKYNAFLAANGIIKLPSSDEWAQSFWRANHLGLLITALLLSLGAPFWYGVLGNLLQLRSVLARKDDEQRAERQSTQTLSGTAAAIRGERGS